METKEYIKQVYDYCYWANKRYFAVAEGLSEEQLHKMQGHSWGDIHAMFVHMMSSEWVWLQRWHGTPPKSHLNKIDFPTLASVKERWNKVEVEMMAYIESQTEESLQAEITYSALAPSDLASTNGNGGAPSDLANTDATKPVLRHLVQP